MHPEEDINDIETRDISEMSKETVEMGNFCALIETILYFYESTGKVDFDEGESWKEGTEHDDRPRNISCPESIETEVQNTFISQLKKFQK